MVEKVDEAGRLGEIAARLAAIHPTGIDQQGIYGLIDGALYGLRRAVRLGFIDRTGAALPKDYGQELTRVAMDLSRSDEVKETLWLAGFYFNSALQRLSPACERLGKYAMTREDLIPLVRQERNCLTHDIPGLLTGRKVSLQDAIDAAGMLVTSLAIVFGKPSS